MGTPVTDRQAMIAGMQPCLREGLWRFANVSPDNAPQLLGSALGTFREAEGVSAIVPVAVADDAGEHGPEMRWITLQVHSALEGVGLTAAVSGALADAGIACNVVAALHHDHLFVPASDADRAIEVLRAVAHAAGGDG